MVPTNANSLEDALQERLYRKQLQELDELEQTQAALMQETYQHTLPGFKDEPQQRKERECHFCSLSSQSWIHQLFRIGTA